MAKPPAPKLPSFMTGFLIILLSTCGVMFYGNGLAPGHLLSKHQTRDDYYENYYLRKIPKLKTSPDKVKQFFLNHLSWFSGNKRNGGFPPYSKSYESFEEGADKGACRPRQGPAAKHKIQNLTQGHRITTSGWVSLKSGPSEPTYKVKGSSKPRRLRVLFKNATRSLMRPSSIADSHPGTCSAEARLRNYKYLGPSVRIHPKSSRSEFVRTATSIPDLLGSIPSPHFSYPRKIKVIIDLSTPERTSKLERNINDNSYLASIEGDASNSSTVLETAGEMASDLAGRVTSLWHSVLGTHHNPDTRDVRFFLYTRRNIIQPELLKLNYDLINKKVKANSSRVDMECVDLAPEDIGEFERISNENREIIKSNFLNLNAPTKILIHGYTGSYRDSRMAKIKDAYLSSGRYNVIQVDWEMLAAPPCYIRVTQHSKFVGETIAQLLDGLYLVGVNMSLVHLVGFSLGAQVAGFAGNNATLVPVCRITGLDPAMPLFLHTQPSGHLDRLDAKFVDVIHTCGGILAMLDPLGHVDFYPNGGTKQPGCEFSNLKCSHSRAPQYFAESVVSQKRFTGQFCFSWEEYVAGDCNNNTNVSYMGEPCSRRSASGKYYLITKSKEPFVL